MKRILLLLCFAISTFAAKAIDYVEARQQAWFLTDKMAYELNLTPEQYDRAYEINLDYLMSLRTPNDCSGYYWQYRNADFRYILYDWQYNIYCTLDYFFRPVRWSHAAWYYPVFDRYRYGYYYFNRPTIYVTYHGGMWDRRGRNTPSPYIGRRPAPGTGMRNHYQNNGGWYGGNPSPSRPQPRPGERYGYPSTPPSHYNGNRPNGNGRSEYNNGGTRPNNGRPNGGRPDNNRSNNNYRDAYTNYRQTGNSGVNYNRGGTSNNTNGRGNAAGVGRERPQRNVQGTHTPAGGRGSGRSFGSR